MRGAEEQPFAEFFAIHMRLSGRRGNENGGAGNRGNEKEGAKNPPPPAVGLEGRAVGGSRGGKKGILVPTSGAFMVLREAGGGGDTSLWAMAVSERSRPTTPGGTEAPGFGGGEGRGKAVGLPVREPPMAARCQRGWEQRCLSAITDWQWIQNEEGGGQFCMTNLRAWTVQPLHL